MTYTPMPTVTEGGEQRVITTDPNNRELMNLLLLQLLKLNTYMELLTDESIDDDELGVER